MKRFLSLVLTLALSLSLMCAYAYAEAAECEHEWAEASCTEPETCTLCGETQGEPLEHDIPYWITEKYSKCSEEGLERGNCSLCGQRVERPIEKKPHNESVWRVAVEATEDGPGTEQIICLNCGEVLQEREYELPPEEVRNRFINACERFSYGMIAYDTEQYIGMKAFVYGEVCQVIREGDDYLLMVWINGNHGQRIAVTYTKEYPEQSDIHEGHFVDMYGIWRDPFTYTTVLLNRNTVPLLECRYMVQK